MNEKQRSQKERAGVERRKAEREREGWEKAVTVAWDQLQGTQEG